MEGEEPHQDLVDDMFKEALVDLGESKPEAQIDLIRGLKSAVQRFANARSIPTPAKLLTNRDGVRAVLRFVA